jgi:hypothetical protein
LHPHQIAFPGLAQAAALLDDGIELVARNPYGHVADHIAALVFHPGHHEGGLHPFGWLIGCKITDDHIIVTGLNHFF